MGAVVSRRPLGVLNPPEPASAGKYLRPAMFAGIAAALFVSRWALFPRYLITFDEINFAFAIREFNPRLHQPQPPGYPLFVALLKILSPLFSHAEPVFLVAALLLSAGSLIFLWRLGELSAGPGWGWSAALLLLFHPAFWLSALTNPVRLSLAFGASLVAWCLWKALSCPARWLPAAAAALGFAGGFQPTLPVLMAPLMLWVAIRAHVRWRPALLSLLCFSASVVLWLPALIQASGGWSYFLLMLRGYSDAQFSGTSLAFGSRLPAAVDMAWKALVWSCLGALSWLPLVPFAVRKPRNPSDLLLPSFLAIWFLPGFLFYAMIHVGDPDHTLSIVPATCVAGAAVLTAIGRRISTRGTALVLSACVVLNVLLFFKPINQTAKASTYKVVKWVDGYTTKVVDGFRSVVCKDPMPAVFHQSSGVWRQISYYAPKADLILVDNGGGNTLMLTRIHGGRGQARRTVRVEETIQACGPLMLFNPTIKPVPPDVILWEEPGALLARPAVGRPLDFYGIRFVSLPRACSAEPPDGEVLRVVDNSLAQAAHAR